MFILLEKRLKDNVNDDAGPEKAQKFDWKQ